MAKKVLKKPDLRGGNFDSFMTEFVRETDRAAVILGAAMVERLLGQILEKHLLPSTGSSDELLEGDAPLATFSAKIKMSHRLGLIDDRFVHLLNTFRRMRNTFAHETSSNSLASGSARDRVMALAEPFAGARMFQALADQIASASRRELNDPGVTFRAVLAVFHLELESILESVEPITARFGRTIVDACAASVPPGDDDQIEAPTE